jgi:hypothetical protein
MKKLPYNIRIDSLSIKDRDKAFSDDEFQMISALIYPTLSKEELNERRVGDISSLHVCTICVVSMNYARKDKGVFKILVGLMIMLSILMKSEKNRRIYLFKQNNKK